MPLQLDVVALEPIVAETTKGEERARESHQRPRARSAVEGDRSVPLGHRERQAQPPEAIDAQEGPF